MGYCLDNNIIDVYFTQPEKMFCIIMSGIFIVANIICIFIYLLNYRKRKRNYNTLVELEKQTIEKCPYYIDSDGQSYTDDV